MKSVDLYHTTNEQCYKSMLSSNYIGLDENDYKRIKQAIYNTYNLTEKQIKYLNKKYFVFNFEPHYNIQMKQGCVSFFPRYNSCKVIKVYAEKGGEWLGLEFSRTLKSIARMKKVSYDDLSNKDSLLYKYCGIGSKAIVLHFRVPTNLLDNYSKKEYDTGMEMCSKQKVSMQYFIESIDI